MAGAMREPFPGYPPPLTTRPEGLLDLLGLQTNGAYPQHLNYQQLDCSIDLLRWYLESQADFINSTVTVNATGSFFTGTDLTVPLGEHWIVLSGTAIGSIGAALQSVCWARANSSGTSVLAMGPVSTALAGSTSLVARTDDVGPWLLRPSVQIGLWGANAASGSVTYTVTLRCARLKTG